MPRYRLTIEYDGTPYFGWQRQDGFISVQQAIEDTVEQFCLHKVTLFGAGRTDTGVHGLGQIAHLDLDKQWDASKVMQATNGLLRKQNHRIAILACEKTSDDFDARFSAKRRHYRYRICNRRPPLTVMLDRAWWVRKRLEADAMHEAAQELVGHYDFTTFRSVNCQAKSPMKTLDALDVKRIDEEWLEITASSRSFLHNQVRSMVGSLKLVGEGKWNARDLASARDAKERQACGPVAPACGLYLARVDY